PYRRHPRGAERRRAPGQDPERLHRHEGQVHDAFRDAPRRACPLRARPGRSRMSPEISERSFEEAIECGLLQHGPDACAGDASAIREMSPPYGELPPCGYGKRRPEDYDRALCLLPRDVVYFVLATQPKEWKKLEQHHGAAVK